MFFIILQMINPEMETVLGGRLLAQTSNLLRVLSAHCDIGLHNAPWDMRVYDKILLLLRHTGDVSTVNNGCRVLLNAVNATLATTPPISQETAEALGFGIDYFMRTDGIMLTLMAIMADTTQKFGEVITYHAIAAFQNIFKMLTPECMTSLVSSHHLLTILYRQLFAPYAKQPNLEETYNKKYLHICKCMYDIVQVDKKLLNMPPTVRTRLVGYVSYTMHNSLGKKSESEKSVLEELGHYGKQILNEVGAV